MVPGSNSTTISSELISTDIENNNKTITTIQIQQQNLFFHLLEIILTCNPVYWKDDLNNTEKEDETHINTLVTPFSFVNILPQHLFKNLPTNTKKELIDNIVNKIKIIK